VHIAITIQRRAAAKEGEYNGFAAPWSYPNAAIWFYTQEDPIGLAGGLNLYGFANGDPVNFSDPLGLCPPCSVSEQGIVFIKRHEGFRANVNEDVGERPTIGYGHLILPGETIQVPLTRGQGDALLRQDLTERVQPGLDLITADLNQNQVDAVGSLIFNVGVSNFAGSKALQKLNAGDFNGAKEEMAEFRLVNDKIDPGLVRRRADERRLFDKKEEGR